MNVLNEISEITFPVSNSVMLMRYSVMIPFCESRAGGSQEMEREVELRATTETF